MRVQGRFSVDANYPAAKGVCDRCSFLYAHRDLQWQYEWAGPKLQNRRLLVCFSCLDTPQEQLRTIILPADPLPILNPRQENYTVDCNPVSPLGTAIGTMTQCGGVNAAFNMGFNKSYIMSAGLPISTVGYTNSVGKNWGTNQTQTIQSFTLYAPNDVAFLAVGTGFKIQGSPNGFVWFDLFTGTSAGAIGEIITGSIANNTPYQYHQVAFNGDGITPVAIAQFVINSANQIQQGDT